MLKYFLKKWIFSLLDRNNLLVYKSKQFLKYERNHKIQKMKNNFEDGDDDEKNLNGEKSIINDDGPV